jgi:hypothetical protein
MKININQNIATHTVILVPGLGDTPRRIKLYARLIKGWSEKYNITSVFFDSSWNDKYETFDQKLHRLLNLINSYETDDIRKLSLLGISAGGSLALNAYFQKKSKVSKVVNVCGRLRVGNNVQPSLETAAKKSKAFYDSVTKCEAGLPTLTDQDKANVLTLKAIFDEFVPTQTTLIDGTSNLTVGSVGHIITIGLCLTIYSKKITNFLQVQPAT